MVGVTNGEFEYKPRLVKLEKAKCGFGFHLLYLEDRQGEYIEDIAQGSPAFQAGKLLFPFFSFIADLDNFLLDNVRMSISLYKGRKCFHLQD